MGSKRRSKAERKTRRDQGLVQRTQKSISHSPIQVLVPDVLVEIFALAMLAEDEEFHHDNWDTVAPINITAVCRHWRTISLASPNLWSTFRHSDTYARTDFPWRHLDTFLHRAAQAPLDIKIHLLLGRHADHRKLLTFIIDNQPHIRNLDVKVGLPLGDPAPETQPLPVLSNLPFLEGLHLEYFQNELSAHLHLTHAPRLRHLFLNGSVSLHLDREHALHDLVFVDLSGEFSFDPLDHLCPEYLTGHDCLMILQASPNIEVFRATRVVHVTEDNPMNPVTDSSCSYLPNLSTLKLVAAHHGAVRDVLGNLHLPGLKELTLRFLDLDSQTCGLYPLLLRSKPVLENLEFDGLNIAEVIQVLESSPTLRDLTISEAGCHLLGMDDLLRRLNLSSDARLCPNIERIEFESCYGLSDLFGEVESVICSRWDRLSAGEERSLKAVTFRECKRWEDLSDKLHKCCREGLEILVIGDTDDEYEDDYLRYSDRWSEEYRLMYCYDLEYDWKMLQYLK